MNLNHFREPWTVAGLWSRWRWRRWRHPCHQHHHPLTQRQPCSWWVQLHTHMLTSPFALTTSPRPRSQNNVSLYYLPWGPSEKMKVRSKLKSVDVQITFDGNVTGWGFWRISLRGNNWPGKKLPVKCCSHTVWHYTYQTSNDTRYQKTSDIKRHQISKTSDIKRHQISKDMTH